MTTQPGNARRGVSLVWGDDGQPEVSLRKGIATANHEPRFDLEVEMDAHEKLRLLYVATTRARDHLVVSAHHRVNAKATYASRIWAFFADRPELWRPSPAETVEQLRLDATIEPPPPPAIEDDRDGWIARRRSLLDPQRAPRVVSATAIARTVDAGLPDTDADGADGVDDETDLAVTVRRQGRAGSAIGRAVHATLQVLDLADPREIDAHARRQCEVESIPELAEQVAATVRGALASDTVRRAVAAPHHKEIFVAAPVGDRVIEGYVDLLIEAPEGLIVVDYKTDSARTEGEIDEKLAAYELQGASYAVVLEAVTGRRVVDCRFVFCRSNGAIERSVHDLDAAKARVRATLEPRS
jgi:ATP-dependent helicase/nuclease subunit A